MRMKRCPTLLHLFSCFAIFLLCQFNSNAKIVFQAGLKHLGAKRYHIYAMEDDGSNLRRITPLHRYDRAPRWFPDGKRIVFERDWGEGKRNTGTTMHREFFIIDETGRNEHSFMVAPHRTGTEPVPSPDGRYIAFDSLRTGELDIYVYDLARDKLTALTNNEIEGGYTQFPSWSPDGSQIVYQNGDAIWVMDADGRRKEEIVPAPVGLTLRTFPCWSPSGKSILYSETHLEPLVRSFIVHKVSTGRRDIHLLPMPEGKYGQVWGLAWMGDDNTVLLSYQEAGNVYNIYRYDLNSRKMTKLTDLPLGHAYYPHWVEGSLAVSPLEKVTTRWGYLKRKLAK